jgi:hypothetical protein
MLNPKPLMLDIRALAGFYLSEISFSKVIDIVLSYVNSFYRKSPTRVFPQFPTATSFNP